MGPCDVNREENVIRNKIIFQVKHSSQGQGGPGKERLVTLGYTNYEGIDYKEVFLLYVEMH